LNHSDGASIRELRVGELLERLGSSEPAPGGGAAAALAGALGAALVQMTANLTIGRPKLAAVEDQARGIETAAGALRGRLAQLGDADADKAARSSAIQAALQVAASVPLDTARACASVLELAEAAAPILNSAVISDVMVGALLAQAALESAAVNVEINLAGMTDASSAQRLADELDRARDGAGERVGRVLDIGRSRFPKPVRKG
jgi:methenyltetrahydrofolate cyclohydrolase